MKEIKSKILDEFLNKNHERSRQKFNLELFQDFCDRFPEPPAYSPFFSSHYQFHQESGVNVIHCENRGWDEREVQ